MVRYAEIACNSNCYPHVVSTTVHYVSRTTAIRKRAVWIVLARHAVYADCACVRCGASLIGVTETAGAECDDYIHNPPPLAEGRAVFRYQGLARKMILELKHGYRPKLAASAAAWMSQIASDILRRPRKTVPLKQFNRSERFAILENAFEINPDKMQDIRERNLILIDDVITPGVTLSAAAKKLQQAGAGDISVLVLARVTENA